MINETDTSEKGLQKLILKELIENQGYIEREDNNFDRELCLDKELLLDFLRDSQPVSYEFIQRKGEKGFLDRLDGKIKTEGIINVLRKGVKHLDKQVFLFYPKPNSIHNDSDNKKYEDNIFSVTEELHYTADNQNRLDLVIFINGLPVITIELKNAFTFQGVKDAIRQYKNDRDPVDKIFNHGRCLVHFAVDTDQVYMTTRLAGDKTFFMPFNKGQNDGRPYAPFGAGNPANPKGLKTSYLWNEILSKDSLANIIEKYIEIEEEKKGKRKVRKLIFPRYHQLLVVRQLLADAKENGVGKKYLIQHSAGSGKSNSITWLALQLVSLYDKDETIPLFDSIIVVTDRQVLDQQIKDNINQFSKIKRTVEWISGNSTAINRLDPTETSYSN